MVNIKEVVHNSKERFLEVQPNGAGLYIGMQAYKAIKDESEYTCLLYTSPSQRDMRRSRLPSSA